MSEYENMRTADIVAEALIDWKVDVIPNVNALLHYVNVKHNIACDIELTTIQKAGREQ
jgi:hypothetical protein